MEKEPEKKSQAEMILSSVEYDRKDSQTQIINEGSYENSDGSYTYTISYDVMYPEARTHREVTVNGENVSDTTICYNKNNKICSKHVVNNNESIEYIYDEFENLIKTDESIMVDSEEKRTIVKYFYNPQNELIQTDTEIIKGNATTLAVTDFASGKEIKKTTYTYDQNNYLLNRKEEDITKEITYIYYYDKKNNITKKEEIDSNGIKTYNYKEDGTYIDYKTKDGTLLYQEISMDNEVVYHLSINDDSDNYIVVNNKKIILNSNGTFLSLDNSNGTYKEIDGNIVLFQDNKEYTFQKNGLILEKKDSNGNIIKYNYDYSSSKTIKDNNGFLTYSKINHIYFEEEEYDNIMKNLIQTYNNYLSRINKEYINIENIISSFNDPYNSNISSIKSTTLEALKKISLLKDKINYSVLSYLSCDKSLKEELDKNIISCLFSGDDSIPIDYYKKEINTNIEDRNNDGIKEFKENVNFISLNEKINNIMPYKDKLGNTLYFNPEGIMVAASDSNIQIEEGNFYIDTIEDEYIILKDSNGNPIDIFGDYNLISNQYGGNQEVFNFENFYYTNPTIRNIIDNRFPNLTELEKHNLLISIAKRGCGPTAYANYTFKALEGKEKEFYEAFGYPMYTIRKKYDENKEVYVGIDYSYEELITDLVTYSIKDKVPTEIELRAAKSNQGLKSISAIYMGTDPGSYESKQMIKYLYDKGIDLDKIREEKKYYVFADGGYTLKNLDGTIAFFDGPNHVMTIIDKDLDGNIYVSTNGKKYIYVPLNEITNLEDLLIYRELCFK